MIVTILTSNCLHEQFLSLKLIQECCTYSGRSGFDAKQLSSHFKKEYDTVCRSDSFRVVESSRHCHYRSRMRLTVDMTENSVTNIIT